MSIVLFIDNQVNGIFHGTMPASLTHMRSLVFFSILAHDSRNLQIYGQLPMLPPSVSVVDFRSLELSGPIPDQWGELTGLIFLKLINMNISGPVKSSLFQNLTSFTTLRLQSLQISGSYPWDDIVPLLSPGKFFTEVRLDDNRQMTGALLPSEFPHGCVLKRLLITNHAGLSGSIPPSINRCKGLYELSISNVGELELEWIPWDEMCGMCNLTSVYLCNPGRYCVRNAKEFFKRCAQENRTVV